jgi:hypothetical protein
MFNICSSNPSGLENYKHDSKDTSRLPRGTLYPQKLALTSSTRGGRSVGKDRSRTQATELSDRRCWISRPQNLEDHPDHHEGIQMRHTRKSSLLSIFQHFIPGAAS